MKSKKSSSKLVDKKLSAQNNIIDVFLKRINQYTERQMKLFEKKLRTSIKKGS